MVSVLQHPKKDYRGYCIILHFSERRIFGNYKPIGMFFCSVSWNASIYQIQSLGLRSVNSDKLVFLPPPFSSLYSHPLETK